MTQGTLSNHDFTQLVGPTLQALPDEPGMLVLVGTGGRPLNELPFALPKNARAAVYLPFEWLLPRIDLMVTIGGYGTVNQALGNGVPLVTAGMTEDKADVNARVQWSGVGINLGNNAPPLQKDLLKAITSVLNETSYNFGLPKWPLNLQT